MSVRSNQVPVGSTPTFIAASSPTGTGGPNGWFYLVGGTAPVFLGGPNVSASNGLSLGSAATLSGYFFSGSNLYGITGAAVGAGTVTVSYLQSGA